jgi:uncharacterized protein YlxW (UPF0749 family)
MSTIRGRLHFSPSWQVTLALALLALGFLVAAQLRSEAPRVRYTTQERGPLVETAQRLGEAQALLKQRLLDLDGQIREVQQAGEGSAGLIRDLNAGLEAARVAAGLVPLQGPGLVLQLEDASGGAPPGQGTGDYTISGQDLRTVVEELWLAGAEAVAVNDERIVTSSAILDLGGLILVNQAYLAPPYRITAIGPADLFGVVTSSAGFADFMRARVDAYGLRLSFAEPASVTVPAFAATIGLRYGRPVEPATSGAGG